MRTTSRSGQSGTSRRSEYSSNGRSSNSSSNNGRLYDTDSEDNDETTAGLRELFLNELKSAYWAEKALVKALDKLADQASSEELQDAINNHIDETEEQVDRLEEIFEILGEDAKTKKCHAMQGLIDEAEDVIGDVDDDDVRDAAIIASAQKVEHYEIATYGTLRTFANLLGEEEVADLLEETLNEEKATDEALNELAENSINIEAVNQ